MFIKQNEGLYCKRWILVTVHQILLLYWIHAYSKICFISPSLKYNTKLDIKQYVLLQFRVVGLKSFSVNIWMSLTWPKCLHVCSQTSRNFLNKQVSHPDSQHPHWDIPSFLNPWMKFSKTRMPYPVSLNSWSPARLGSTSDFGWMRRVSRSLRGADWEVSPWTLPENHHQQSNRILILHNHCGLVNGHQKIRWTWVVPVNQWQKDVYPPVIPQTVKNWPRKCQTNL